MNKNGWIIILMIVLFPLMAFTCEDKVEGGHKCITFVNNSADTVWIAEMKINNFRVSVDTLCKCDNYEIELMPKDNFLFTPTNNYWETDFKVWHYMQIFVFSRSSFESKSCEEARKHQLKRYQLTKEDLDRMNWTVVYPPEE